MLLSGLISKDEFEDLNKIKNIRNAYAHHLKSYSFDEPAIKSEIENLKAVSKLNASSVATREKFTMAIYFLDSVLRFREENVQRQVAAKEMRMG